MIQKDVKNYCKKIIIVKCLLEIVGKHCVKIICRHQIFYLILLEKKLKGQVD